MKCGFKTNIDKPASAGQVSLVRGIGTGFSLVEVVTALAIVALMCSSVLVVIDRSLAKVVESSLKMQAFEVAREKMEEILAGPVVYESVEYGTSERYPDVSWQTTVETFYEPCKSQMWARAVCAAEYIDSEGETQTVELRHWLNSITKEQMLKLIEQKQRQLTENDIIESSELAAYYAGISADTLQQWLDNGMPVTEDGEFIKDELDFYSYHEGNPSIEDKMRREEAQSQPALDEYGQDEAGDLEQETESYDEAGDREQETEGEGEEGKDEQKTDKDKSSGLPDDFREWSLEEIIEWIRNKNVR